MGETVIISSSDCLSPLGGNIDDTWKALSAGEVGVRKISRYRPEDQAQEGISAIQYAGEIPMSIEDLAGSTVRLQKWVEPGYHAARALVSRVLYRLSFDIHKHDPQRIALLGATVLTSQHARAAQRASRHPDAKLMLNQCHHMPLSAVAAEFRLMGPSFSVGSACSSSAHALYLAALMIRSKALDVAIVVGHEFPLLPEAVAGFDWMGTLYRRDEPNDRAFAEPARASRPFSRDRRGFVLAEGAAAVVLTSAAYADRHGWPRLATLRGAFANSDADQPTRPSAENVARCMRGALADAWIGPDHIDCIHAHATSTSAGDRAEMNAMHEVFGPLFGHMPVVASKGQLGHSLGASALLSIVLATRGMAENVVLPTVNYEPDPTMPHALISSTAMERRHKTALVSSLGLGGTNVSFVVQKGPDARAPQSSPPTHGNTGGHGGGANHDRGGAARCASATAANHGLTPARSSFVPERRRASERTTQVLPPAPPTEAHLPE